MSDLITHLDELREKATQGEWDGLPEEWDDETPEGLILRDEDLELIVALHNAYPQLRERIKAGEELAKAIQGEKDWLNDHGHNPLSDETTLAVYRGLTERVLIALEAYRKATNT